VPSHQSPVLLWEKCLHKSRQMKLVAPLHFFCNFQLEAMLMMS
jgi:hypothetical protein